MNPSFCSDDSLNPNCYSGSDSERIRRAAEAALAVGAPIRIPVRRPDAESSRTFWLIDSAILLPGNATLILDNCRIKLSDRCRDNFIRSANCGCGIGEIAPLENIHILGIGNAVLEGADHPRATGDSAKILGERTYGTDAGKPGETQNGDWRNIGILLARVRNFSIRDLVIRDSHAWAVSLEYCCDGFIRNLAFHSEGGKVIDGVRQTILNQDGLDLRRGCRNIVIDTITGGTGDDLVALTAIGAGEKQGGVFGRTEIASAGDPGMCEDIESITLRNIVGHCAGGHHIVRFLNTGGIKMRNIILDGVVDTSPEGVCDYAAVRIGDANPAWGGVTPLGDTAGFRIVNILSRAAQAVLIAGSLADSIISDVINGNPDTEPVCCSSGEESLENVEIRSTLTVIPR